MKKLCLIVSCLILLSCQESKQKIAYWVINTECIENIIAADDSLGSIRNERSKSVTLSQTINEYVGALEILDYKNCPESFTSAFKKHQAAWLEMIILTNKHNDLRGEMHDVFDTIEQTKDSTQFKTLLKQIWDTWEGVEKSMQ